MHFHIISLFPEDMKSLLNFSVLQKAQSKGLIEFSYSNPRDFTDDKHHSVDDKPFSGGDGMLMLYEPLARSIDAVKKANVKVVHLSPQGKLWNQEMANQWAKENKEIIFVCSRYSGIDHRLLATHIDEEVSIGDFVISGGELAAAVVIDSICRQIPGVLGNQRSAKEDSFQAYSALEPPQFTRPAKREGLASVPEVLLSGDHKKIEEWHQHMSLLITALKRPELLSQFGLEQRRQALDYWLKMDKSERQMLGLEICPLHPNTLDPPGREC